jgi:hypothetical protein
MKKFLQQNKIIIFWLVKICFIWRLFLIAISVIAQKFLLFKESFPFSEIFLKPNGPELLRCWGNFDGVHYLSLAQNGYRGLINYEQTFFPLYPFLINKLSFNFNPLIIALIISNTALFIALFLLFKLINLNFSEKVAKTTIIFLLVFPASFFLGSVYNESLFLTFCLASFYFAKTKKWFLASVMGFLAASTRLVGVFLLPALFFEWSEQRKGKIKELLSLFIIPVGLLIFMIYLKAHFNDPLYFLHLQPLYGASRSSDKIILFHQVTWRYLKMIFTVDPRSLLYLTIWLEFLTFLLFLFLIIQQFLKKFPASYLTFSILSFITPTLTGTFSSLPRYVLVLFPCFIILSQLIINKKLKTLWLIVNLLLLAFFCALFTRGYWVA